MPLTPYIRPQSTITQLLRMTAVPQADRTNPVVIGPQYKLILDDGRPMIEHDFLTAGATLTYAELVAGVTVPMNLALYTPQFATAKLIGRDLMAEVSGTLDTDLTSLDAEHAVLQLSTLTAADNFADYRESGFTLATNLRGRSVRVGDYVKAVAARATGGNVTAWRKVTALLPRMSNPAPHVDAVTPANTTTVAAVAYEGSDAAAAATITAGGTYTGTFDTSYVIDVVTGGTFASGAVVLRVWDSSGSEPVTTISGNLATGSPFTIGSKGVTLTFVDDTTTYVVGHKFHVDAVASTAVDLQFDRIRLDSAICAVAGVTGVTVTVHQAFSGEITDDNIVAGAAFTPTATDASYGTSLGLRYDVTGTDSAFSPFAAGFGKLVLSFKALKLPTATEGPIVIESVSDITELLGETSPENWLARATYEAFSGNQGNKVYALRTGADTVASFTTALNKIRSSDVYYALCPLTDRLDVMQLVADHCTEMSNKYNRNFRRCYVGTDSPGEVTAWGQLTSGMFRRASLTGQVLQVVEDDRSISNFESDAIVGDFVKFNSSASRFPILEIISPYEVVLDCPSGTTIPVDGFQLIRAASTGNTVRFLQERAAALANRRCVNVWCDNPSYVGSAGSEVLPMKFVAAEIAGLRCALLPQQGLTMTEVTSITSAPTMYTTFLPSDLDDVAAAGNMVVTQESLNGEIFIRHQLTTDVSNGSLAYQDNVGVIVDIFSYGEKDRFRNYIGRRNVTQDTIDDLRTELLNWAIECTQVAASDAQYGPLIIRFFDENGKEGAVTVAVDGQVADRLRTYVKLRVALPLDGLDNYVDVESSVSL